MDVDYYVHKSIEDKDCLKLCLYLSKVPNVPAFLASRPHYLIRAISSESINIFKVLVEYYADVDFRWAKGVTPLMVAARHSLSIVKSLVEAKANINAQDDNGRTPLMFAAIEGGYEHESITTYLMEHGADLSLCDVYGRTALDYWIEKDESPMVSLMLSDSYIKQFDQNRLESSLHQATFHGNLMARFLLQTQRVLI